MAPGNVNDVGLKKGEASAGSRSELYQTKARLSNGGIPLTLKGCGNCS